jgi:hypothetical protein
MRRARVPPPPPGPVLVPVPRRKLVLWNASLGALHFALLVATLGAGNLGLQGPLYKTQLDFVDFSDNSTTRRGWELVPYYVPTGGLPLTWLVALFFGLTSAFHFGNALVWRDFYFAQLERCYSPTRWIEYFFSAPPMIVLIGYSLGVRDRSMLLALAGLTAATMPYGYVVEVFARPKSLTEWEAPVWWRLLPWALGHVPQLVAWIVILLQFHDSRYDPDDVTPSWVYAILYVELLLFLSFGAASALSHWDAPEHYVRGEILFQVLSLVSKGLLGLLLLVNVLMQAEFDY